MAKVFLSHNPSLTKEELKKIFENHFSTAGYTVGLSPMIGADLHIHKNGWVGANLKLKQKDDTTFLRINGYAPSVFARLLLGGLLFIIIMRPKWNRFVDEISMYTQSEDFNKALTALKN